jgi:acetyltransferase-like isoleucine patch superfamily enzyme
MSNTVGPPVKAELRKIAANPGAAISSAVATAYFRLRRVKMVGRVLCVGRPPILFTGGHVSVGPNVIFRGLMLRAEFGAVSGGVITVGEDTFINEGSSIVAHHSVQIGTNCRIGEFVGIFDTDHHAVDSAKNVRFAPVEIGNNVWIGRAAIVLPGVRIGNNSVVASGSVVTADVPVNTLVAGNPARVVRKLHIEAGWLRS